MQGNGQCDDACFVNECDYDRNDKSACMGTYLVYSDQLSSNSDYFYSFPTIDFAFYYIDFDRFVEILLVGNGKFYFFSNFYYDSFCLENMYGNYFDITIRPLYCSENNIDGCYKEGEKATVVVSNEGCIRVYQYLTIENAIFTQEDTVDPYCETCNYCRTVITNDSGTYDDQGNILDANNYVPSHFCGEYNSKELFSLLDNSALLLKVTIT